MTFEQKLSEPKKRFYKKLFNVSSSKDLNLTLGIAFHQSKPSNLSKLSRQNLFIADMKQKAKPSQ